MIKVHEDCKLHPTPDGMPPGHDSPKHPGHWELHHLALSTGRRGDFTPERPAEYAESEVSPMEELWRHIAWVATGHPELAPVYIPDRLQAQWEPA